MKYKKLEKRFEEIKKNILESKEQFFYHGSNYNFTKFSNNFVGKGNDQFGPGIYFSSLLKEALQYSGEGGYVYKCRLNTTKQLNKNERYVEKHDEKNVSI